MATIPVQATGLRHVRKTVTLDGSANNGNLGDDVTLFTITGRVLLSRTGAVYVSSALVCAAPTLTALELTVPSAVPGDTIQWLVSGSDFTGATGWMPGNNSPVDVLAGGFMSGGLQPIAENIVLRVRDQVGGADVTGGTIIVDLSYLPITDDGALAGDDIDLELGAYLADKILDEALSGHTTAGSLGKAVADVEVDTSTTLQGELDGIQADTEDIQTKIGTPAGVSVSADIAAVKAETAAIVADTNELQTDDYPTTLATLATAAELAKVPKSDGTASWNATALAAIQSEANDALVAYDPPTNAELTTAQGVITALLPAALVGGRMDATVDATGMEAGAIDAILTRTMTEAYAAAGAEMTVAQALYEICQVFSEFAISGSTITVKQRDGSTTAMTFTLDSAIQPTSRTRAT